MSRCKARSPSANVWCLDLTDDVFSVPIIILSAGWRNLRRVGQKKSIYRYCNVYCVSDKILLLPNHPWLYVWAVATWVLIFLTVDHLLIHSRNTVWITTTSLLLVAVVVTTTNTFKYSWSVWSFVWIFSDSKDVWCAVSNNKIASVN